MRYDIENIGNRIYMARQDNGLKQYEVYKRLGISQSAYSKIEGGKSNISITLLCKIASILDVPVSWLIGENSSPQLTNTERLELEKYRQYIISIRKKI
jgi:transcriptional regulator with XRE-family HTH domain